MGNFSALQAIPKHISKARMNMADKARAVFFSFPPKMTATTDVPDRPGVFHGGYRLATVAQSAVLRGFGEVTRILPSAFCPAVMTWLAAFAGATTAGRCDLTRCASYQCKSCALCPAGEGN
jgi:hypothetical protein